MWSVGPGECAVEAGVIRHAGSGRECRFSEVLELAAAIDPPDGYAVPLKDPSLFQIIGTSKKRVDAPEMVRGSFQYASDIVLEDMAYAVIERPPVFGSRLAGYDESTVLAVEGVEAVVEVSSGVAVVANSTWAALKGRQSLQVAWEDQGSINLSSESIRQRLYDAVVPGGWRPGADPSDRLSAVYEVPFLAHATQEPMMCVAHVTADGCEVWAPTQNPRSAQQVAAQASGRSLQDVRLNVMVSGGGFGRRLQIDYVREVVEISASIGRPVKLFWTREDDIRHDFYHPLSVHHLEASLSPPGLPRIRSRESDAIPTGAWRSVNNFTDAFVRESFIDEMAAVLDRDPLELRLEIEPASLRPVLERVADEAGWGSPLPDGWGRGIACHSTWDVTPVAEVAEVSLSPEGAFKVERIVCAIDCGIVINPNMVREQMEGGIAFGLSAALNGGVTLNAGAIEQSNFHDYPMLNLSGMPLVEVHILENDRDPSGVGEMGIPPAAPAVANAIYNLTGQRNRTFPLRTG
jgi:isoquinoline 1-oxidoreductase beta subunit